MNAEKTAQIVARPPLLVSLARAGGVALVYFLAARMSLAFVLKPEGIAPIWPPSGIFLAALLLSRRSEWPYLVGSVFLADLAAETLAGSPLIISLTYAAVVCGDALLGASLMLRFAGRRITFARVRDVIVLLFVAATLSNALAASIAAAAPALVLGAPYGRSWVWWWTSGGLGVLLITPLLVTWFLGGRISIKAMRPIRIAEAGLVGMAIVAVDYALFSGLFRDFGFGRALVLSAFPLLIWAALRFGVRGAATAAFFLAGISIHSLLSGQGPVFALSSSGAGIVLGVQIYMAVLSVSSLILAAAVAERKEAEKAFARERNLLRHIMDNMPDYIYVKDAESRFLVNNEAHLRILGAKTQEEVAGKTDFDIFPEELAQEYYADEQAIVRSGRPVVNREETAVEPDGREQVVLTTKAPVRDSQGNVTGIVGISRDITTLKRSQEQLAEKERFLADVFSSIQDGISVLDNSMRIVAVNAVIERWYAHAMPLAGKRCFEAYHGRTEPCEICPTRRTLETGLSAFEIVPKRDSAGTIEGWLDLYSFPMFDGRTGAVTGVIEYVRDITEKRRIEERLQEAQKLDSLREMAGGIAHDFNNILHGILGNINLAIEEVPGDGSLRESLESVEELAVRASQLSRQMLAYTGKGLAAVEIVDLNRILREAGPSFAASAPEGVRFVYELAGGELAIEADSSQIRQVLSRLVANGVEAIAPAGGVITISSGMAEFDNSQPRSVHDAADALRGRYVYFTVADTGCGMDAETRKKAFDPFFTTKFIGRGLGLSEVLGLVHSHHGSIRVESEPGHGSTFTILLPASDRPVPTKPADKKTPGGALPAGGTILVVDDEPAVCDLSKCVLEQAGFEILTATDGAAAVDVFRRNADRITAVLLDLTMPGMDGIKTFHALREAGNKAPVILSSGYGEQTIAGRYAEEGFAGFIEKPYPPKGLAARLQEMLSVLPPYTPKA